MILQEKKLFWALVRCEDDCLDKSLLKYATPEVLGHIFYNRMQGIAYCALKNNGALSLINREFRNSLRDQYEMNLRKNESYRKCVSHVSNMIEETGARAALTKGAVLSFRYPEGCRTSNDVDILALPDDVSKIGERLLADGFFQGYIRNDSFIPATREQIIRSKMTRGETVPFVKEVDLPEMRYLEIDLNFSLDYKNSDDCILEEVLKKAEKRKIKDNNIVTLSSADFFIHLCCHLHKEATTMPWIEMRRDMTLYKYADIYLLAGKMFAEETDELFERSRELGLDMIVASAVLHTAKLFNIDKNQMVKKAHDILGEKENLLDEVVSPTKNLRYRYKTKDVSKRFFMKDRRKDLYLVP